MALPMWFTLSCPCGSDKFTAIVHLRAHPTGGSSTQHGGYLCVDCGKVADMGKLIQDHHLRLKKEELKQLEAQIKATSPTS